MSDKKYLNQDPHTVLKEVWGYDNFRENQLEAVTDILEGNKDVLFLARTGLGKALHKDTKVLMADNTYKAISKIDKGDIVLGANGKPSKVLYKVKPKVKGFYKLVFKDKNTGKLTTTKACKDHLWVVENITCCQDE